MLVGFYLLLGKKFKMHPYPLYATLCLSLAFNFFIEYNVLFIFNADVVHTLLKTVYFFRILFDKGIFLGLKIVFGGDSMFLHEFITPEMHYVMLNLLITLWKVLTILS